MSGGLDASIQHLESTVCLVSACLLGMPIACFDMPQVTSLGVAMCAATGCGVYPDLEQAMEAMRPEPTVVEPDPERAREYTQCYGRWLAAAQWLDNLCGGMT